MNSLKLIARQLWKHKLYTFLNILGLAIGISACWVVFKIVIYEYSFDANQPNKEHIYKVYNSSTRAGVTRTIDGMHAPVAAYIKEHNPEVEYVVPINYRYFDLITAEGEGASKEKFIQPEEVRSTVSDYFKMVPYTWLAGNANGIFKTANEIVLTESRAKQYFPNVPYSSLIGKNLKLDTSLYAVTGVVADLPVNTIFKGKEFIPVSDAEYHSTDWISFNSIYVLFIQLREGTKTNNLLRSLNNHLNEINKEAYIKDNYKTAYHLQPLETLHFNNQLGGSTNKNILYGMMAIGGFLLALACINYINLFTAQIPFRAKEFGIRKTLGEKAGHLTRSFLLETSIICLFALFLSWPLTGILQHFFSTYVPEGMYQVQENMKLVVFLILLLGFVVLLTSLYPSYLASRVRVIEVIKLKHTRGVKFGNLSFRKVLIIFQFVIAQVFVVATIIIGFQLKYLINQDLGFKKDGIITIKLPTLEFEDGQVNPFLIKEALGKYKEIEAVSLGHLPLNQSYWGKRFTLNTDTGELRKDLEVKYIDGQFLDVYGLKLLAGRLPQLSDTSTGLMLTEQAVKDFGFKSNQEAVGQIIKELENPKTIIGVLQDYSNQPLKYNSNPIAFFASNKREMLNFLSIRLAGDSRQWQKAIGNIEKEWKVFYPNASFKYEFYDDQVASFYETDQKFSSAISLSSGITILLSCLGLIGLVTLTTIQRTKEIGIRKVLGSTISGIVTLISKDYLVLILISILIATPIGWYLMNKWLLNYEHRIDLSWWMFVIPAVITLVMAFLTMSYQSLKAARTNPVDSLKDE